MQELAFLIFDNLLFKGLGQASVANYDRGMEGHFPIGSSVLLRRGCVNDLEQLSGVDVFVYDLI